MSGVRTECAELLSGLSVRRLRWMFHQADADLTIEEAVEAAADAEEQEDAVGEHQALVDEYHRDLARRRHRERDLPQRAFDEAREAAIRRGPISREAALAAGKEASDIERVRFEVYEPQLSFEEWIAAGRPEIHTTRLKGHSAT